MPTSQPTARASASIVAAYAAMQMNATEYTGLTNADPWLCLAGLHHDFTPMPPSLLSGYPTGGVGFFNGAAVRKADAQPV